MKFQLPVNRKLVLTCLVALNLTTAASCMKEREPQVPRFSVEHMDKTVSPSEDFYHYASGNWVKRNPVPKDKSVWTSFGELDARNEYLLHTILEDAVKDKSSIPGSPAKLVGDFYASAMDTQTLENLKLQPIQADLDAIDKINDKESLFSLIANLHNSGSNAFFDTGVAPDEKKSSIYAFQIMQGGLSLPDRDYYLKPEFAKQRDAYLSHITRMLQLRGESHKASVEHANTILNIETALAKASRSRVALRDPEKNYNKYAYADLIRQHPTIPWKTYFTTLGVQKIDYVIVGQPEFLTSVEKLIQEKSLSDWKVYLQWNTLRSAAPYLSKAFDEENFNFFGKVIHGQEQQRERWKRANGVIDGTIGEALGKLYVDKYFTPDAKKRMEELVTNLRVVFHEHLQKVDWMSETTRSKALAKFDRFTHKIGYPERFRDYSKLVIKADDFYGNIRRAIQFESKRQLNRIGQAVDKSEWQMTPPTVNAYFEPTMNEIVFPAGILQPPFFDPEMDDAVNYGAIAVVIGHEITHGYDDQGRHYNTEGSLEDWWTAEDAKAFTERAQKLINEYNTFEMLPGAHVNGELTLGENIADLGGISIAYDALKRALKENPSKQKLIDGLTPEQRFFISYAQIWRTNIKPEEARQRLTTDPHAPGKFRAYGPLLNYETFYEAFNITPGSPMWLAPELRTKIW